MKRLLPALAALALGALPALAASPAPAAPTYEVREVFSPSGSIERVRVPVQPVTSPQEVAAAASAVSKVVPLQVRGPVDTTYDLVLVGDGYAAGQQGLFRKHAASKVAELFGVEPFRSYRGLFNVWLVEVVSPQSGVDADPLPGSLRDTALDMEFWCNGTERLLCVDTAKAQAAAKAAPAVDHVLAIANSTKYGGAGGVVATASGGNDKSGQVAVHELGHSIGDLADEYDSPYPYGPHVGDAPESNASVLPEPVMTSQQTKWWRWMGKPTPDGGVIGTFLGGRYNPVVYYRPSDNSIMRSLGREFNLVGREAMVLGFYKAADPLTSSTPASESASRTAVLRVVTPRPVGSAMRVTWSVDGKVVARDKSALDLRTLRLAKGGHVVEVTVTDLTAWVLPSAMRDSRLTATASWRVT